MERHEEVLRLLKEIQSQAEELLSNENLYDLSASEIIVLAAELLTGLPVTTIEYSQPIGIVDRERTLFILDEDTAYPLFGDVYYGTEEED